MFKNEINYNYKDPVKLKVRAAWKKVCCDNMNQKKVGVVLLISDIRHT